MRGMYHLQVQQTVHSDRPVQGVRAVTVQGHTPVSAANLCSTRVASLLSCHIRDLASGSMPLSVYDLTLLPRSLK